MNEFCKSLLVYFFFWAPVTDWLTFYLADHLKRATLLREAILKHHDALKTAMKLVTRQKAIVAYQRLTMNVRLEEKEINICVNTVHNTKRRAKKDLLD